MQATVLSVDDDVVEVVMPKVTDDTNSMSIACEVAVSVDTRKAVLATDFSYEKVWRLKTVTGNGESSFKAGTLTTAQLKARFITIGENGDIFANHRDGKPRQVIRINEASNIVESISGDVATWVPNGPTYGPDGIVYVAADGGNGREYYTLEKGVDRVWTTTKHTVDFGVDENNIPNKDAYMYRLVYNTQDECLYGFVGSSGHSSTNGKYGSFITKINPKTDTGTLFYLWENKNPYWYAQTFSSDYSKLYIGVGANGIDYGLWEMSMKNENKFFTRLNSNGEKDAATSATLNDGTLANAGFGACWGMDWGPDGRLYMSDATNHIIRAIDLVTNTVETFFGIAGSSGTDDGLKDVGKLNDPRGIAWNKEGTALYVADFGSCRIRKICME